MNDLLKQNGVNEEVSNSAEGHSAQNHSEKRYNLVIDFNAAETLFVVEAIFDMNDIDIIPYRPSVGADCRQQTLLKKLEKTESISKDY